MSYLPCSTEKSFLVKALKCMCIIILPLIFLAGCVTQGTYFPSETQWIKDSVTTQNDVKNVLGDPYAVGSSSGTPSWTYGYYVYKLFGKSYTKELKFYWKSNKTLDNFNFNSSFPEDTEKTSKQH